VFNRPTFRVTMVDYNQLTPRSKLLNQDFLLATCSFSVTKTAASNHSAKRPYICRVIKFRLLANLLQIECINLKRDQLALCIKCRLHVSALGGAQPHDSSSHLYNSSRVAGVESANRISGAD